MVPWLKIWHEARNDAKLRTLTDREFRTWFNLICYSSEQPLRGTIEAPVKLIAIEVSNSDEDALLECVTTLESLQIVTGRYTENGLFRVVFLNFEKRQSLHASDAPERVKERVGKHRYRKKIGDVTSDVTSGNGSVTTPVTTVDKIRLEEEGIPPCSPPTGGRTTKRSRSRSPRESATQRHIRELQEAMRAKQAEIDGKEAERGDG